MSTKGTLLFLFLVLADSLAAAQLPPTLLRIGLLIPGTLTEPEEKRDLDLFLQSLSEHGYRVGENVALEFRAANGRSDLLPTLAAELVRLRVSVIVAVGTTAIAAALKTTKTVPIVMISGGDPVGRGFVRSSAEPGGNVTGLSSVADGDEGKRVELLKDAFPWISRIFVLNADRRISRLETYFREAKGMGVSLEAVQIVTPEDLRVKFSALTPARTDGLITIRNLLTIRHAEEIIDFALRSRLPSIYESREFVERGGLMAYGVDYETSWRRAPSYIDKILKGANPAFLPVEPPQFKFSINLRTANRMKYTIPPAILLEASEVLR